MITIFCLFLYRSCFQNNNILNRIRIVTFWYVGVLLSSLKKLSFSFYLRMDAKFTEKGFEVWMSKREGNLIKYLWHDVTHCVATRNFTLKNFSNRNSVKSTFLLFYSVSCFDEIFFGRETFHFSTLTTTWKHRYLDCPLAKYFPKGLWM